MQVIFESTTGKTALRTQLHNPRVLELVYVETGQVIDRYHLGVYALFRPGHDAMFIDTESGKSWAPQ